jgi:hypothetical protein
MRHSYKTALRAKGIKPLPAFDKMRSSHKVDDADRHVIVTATKPKRWA